MNESVNYRIHRARITIEEALTALEEGLFYNVLNREYYAVFYAASALAKSQEYDFSNEENLKIWFKDFNNKTKSFPPRFSDLYDKLYINRMEADFKDFIELDETEIKNHFSDMLIVVDEIEKYLLK